MLPPWLSTHRSLPQTPNANARAPLKNKNQIEGHHHAINRQPVNGFVLTEWILLIRLSTINYPALRIQMVNGGGALNHSGAIT
jgi:hypothetical protein